MVSSVGSGADSHAPAASHERITMKVKEIMVQEVKCCGLADTLNRAAQIMWENDCGCVPIVSDETRLVGILTDRDICMAAYTRGAALGAIAVSSTMSREPFSCQATDDVLNAQRIMREHRVRRLPVTDADARLIGIVSLTDIARAMEITHSAAGKAKVADTLVDICTPHAGAAHQRPTQIQGPQKTVLARGDKPERKTRVRGPSSKGPRD
jgi:CBS domain-containing protein